ncbi:MAG: hypothetical protein U9R54_08820, partial [Bacteroidota bacterium]|nr:hypothetical protein [Bacteroidota bacterium]
MLKFNKLSHIFYLKDSLSKLLLFAILLINYPAYSQFYDTGSEPTSVKWKQINTNNFQIIFDEEFYSEANRIANILEYSYNSVSEGLNNKPKKVSVIIHNNTVKSNGYVSWAPKRIEMYATPSQEMYPQDWLEQLCVHELRHVVQIDKLNQGITKILSIVFGQQATGVITGFLPLWYLEGDAVFTETVLTKSGRGRLPSFEKELRTILLCDEEQFSIYKTMFGSYKNFVPTYYKYGYNLRSYAQKRYGDSISNNVENFVAKHPFTIFPFHFAIKKYTAGNIKNLYNDTYEYLDSTWKSEDIKSTNYQLFSDIKDKDYENYSDPQFVDNNKIIALKSGLSHLKQIVLIDSSKQSILHEPGILSSQDLSYENNKVVWAEKRRDVRWENREYSELQILDINSKQIRQITSKSRYFAPDLSEKANKIVCIESDKKNNCYLTFLSTFNGKEYAKIKSPEGVFLQNPEWSTDNNFVYVIAVNKNGKGILRYNLEKKIWENILPFSYDDIQNIRITGDNLYYHSSYSGIDNIYLHKINT